MNPLLQLKELGQSPWLDYIDRNLLEDGSFRRMMSQDGICGITSNPAILKKAITETDGYRDAITRLRGQCDSTESLYEALALEDIRMAADQLAPVHQATQGRDGLVSLEVSPELAHDSEGSIHEARRIWSAIDRPNAMIKIPATRAGLVAIRELTALGINVNATLIFDVTRYGEVADAWAEGIARRIAQGQPVDRMASVASFFVSRIDTLADRLLVERAETRPEALRLQGKVAVACAKEAYQWFRERLASQWRHLEEQGVAVQRLLWASTSTKNPAYSDIKYVEELIGPRTVNTLPPRTLAAYRDHGQPAPRLETGLEEARETLSRLAALGIDRHEMARRLEQEGVEKFRTAYHELLEALADACR